MAAARALVATTIALPADREYKVISRQDLAFADTTSVRDGKLRGQLHISQPEEFWSALWITAAFTGLVVALVVGLGIAFALLYSTLAVPLASHIILSSAVATMRRSCTMSKTTCR